VYCNGCSSHRALLDPSDIIHDPSAPGDHSQVPSLQRVCQSCFDEVNTDVPGQLQSSQVAGMETVIVQQQSLTVPGTRRGDASSQISDLAEWVSSLPCSDSQLTIHLILVVQFVVRVSPSSDQLTCRRRTCALVSMEAVVPECSKQENTSCTRSVDLPLQTLHGVLIIS
jgi:hypothetical protein